MPFPQRVRLLFGSLSPGKFGDEISSFADLGCFARILNPESECFSSQIQDTGSKFFSSWIPWSQIWIFFILGPGSRMHIKEFKYFNQKNGFSALRNMIQVFHPGSGSRVCILTFYLSQIPILDPRSRIQDPDSQHWRFRVCSGCRG